MARTNTRRDHQNRAAFFEEGKRLDADPETRHLANCWRCEQRINYDVPPNSTPDSHNLGHFKPVRDYPELQSDPTNHRHEHALCNQSAGAGMHTLGLGDAVPNWW